MNRMQVALFSNRAKAEPIQKRLADCGIHAEIHEELRLEKLWYVSRQSAGARLEVAADEFERAQNLLLEWDASEGPLRDAIRCPECKSLRVDFPQNAKHSFIPNLVIGFLSSVGRVEREYYCEDCHFTWPRQGTKLSALRPHMAPYYFIEGVEQTTLPQAAQPDDKRKAA
jgi:hypothetical protein